WNGWKGQLIRELFAATEAVFRGGRGAEAIESARHHQHDRAEALRASLPAEAAEWVEGMEDAYFTGWTAPEITAHANLARRAVAEGGAAASARIRPEHNAAEITLAAADRLGLFAD